MEKRAILFRYELEIRAQQGNIYYVPRHLIYLSDVHFIVGDVCSANRSRRIQDTIQNKGQALSTRLSTLQRNPATEATTKLR